MGRLLLRVLGLLVLAGFFALAFTPLAGALHAALAVPSRLDAADAVVVLGAGVDADGALTDASLRRAVHGVELYRRGLAPLLLLLGPPDPTGRVVEAEARARLARELGVPVAALLVEPGGLTTRHEASRAAALLLPRAAARVLLVTGSHHMRRAAALFERAGFETLPAPTDEVSPSAERPEDRLRLVRFLAQEILARAYHRVAGYL